jgi:hypothetical protein
MLNYITIIFFLLTSTLSSAQIMNIEKFRLDKDTSNVFMGSTGFGFSSKKQQNTVFEYDAFFNLAYLSKKHSYMTINYSQLQQANTKNIISEGYTHFRINFFRHQLISYEPFVQFQYDLGRGLYNRNLGGFSFRLNVIKNDSKHHNKIELGINTGAMYEYEHWQGNVLRFPSALDSARAYTHFLKSSTSLFAKASLHENITLFSIFYYQARFDDYFRPRFVSDIQLVFNISKRFSFSNKFTSTLDAAPIVQNNNFIYTLSSNLVIKFN